MLGGAVMGPWRTIQRLSLRAAVIIAALLVGVALLSGGGPAAAQGLGDAGPTAQGPAGSGRIAVIVSFHRPPGAAEVSTVEALGGSIRFRYRIIPAIAAEFPVAALDALRRHPLVRRVEPDVVIEAFDHGPDTDDPELESSWGVEHIGAGAVHPYNTGAGVKVAVIDTGVDYTHPDLDDSYVDGYDFINGDDDPMDDLGHGTHVAGIIAADADGAGVVGVAPNADIYAYKILDDQGFGNESDLIAALECASGNDPTPGGLAGAACVKMDVINMSIGTSVHVAALEQAVAAAHSQGIVLVAASGNVNPNDIMEVFFGCAVKYPAAYDDSVIAVTFTDQADSLTGSSCTGPQVDFGAPGELIRSSVPTGTCMLCDPSGYLLLRGTSMASPHAAGLVALLIASGMSGPDAIEAQMCLTAKMGQGPSPGNPLWYGCGVVYAGDVGPAAGNLAPIADAGVDQTVSDDGDGVVTVTLDGSGSSDGDGTIVSYEWTEGATVLGTVAIIDPSLAIGTHAVTLTVTDNGGATASDDVVITVVADGEPPAAAAMFVSQLQKSQVTSGKNPRYQVIVGIKSGSDGVAEAIVEGWWLVNGAAEKAASGTTGSQGLVTIESGRLKGETVTFCVTSVSRDGFAYNPALNLDGDGSWACGQSPEPPPDGGGGGKGNKGKKPN